MNRGAIGPLNQQVIVGVAGCAWGERTCDIVEAGYQGCATRRDGGLQGCANRDIATINSINSKGLVVELNDVARGHAGDDVGAFQVDG